MKPSSYILFARKIKGKNWPRVTIQRKFFNEVDKSDYNHADLYPILDNLYALAKKRLY